LRSALASAVEAVMNDAQDGAAAVNARAAEALALEDLPQLASIQPGLVDVRELWRGRLDGSPAAKAAAAHALTGLRGAQSGIVLLGLASNLAGLALTAGATLGIGAIFGGKQILDERRRQAASRRQQARQAVRQFVDDVQFEASKSFRDLARDLQRRARDHFSAEMTAAAQGLAASAERLRSAASLEESERRRQIAAVESHLAAAREIERLLVAGRAQP
jgi:hypothetical protein